MALPLLQVLTVVLGFLVYQKSTGKAGKIRHIDEYQKRVLANNI
jgi:hypothetical protein